MPGNPRRRVEVPVAPVFDVCIHGQPVSAQTSNRPALDVWKQRVSQACKAAWPDDLPPLEGLVRLRVTVYFERNVGDVDNIVKPIQDVLQGIAYRNDRQVSEVHGRRFNINGPFVARFMSRRLGMAFSDGRPFVHIEIWPDPNQEMIR